MKDRWIHRSVDALFISLQRESPQQSAGGEVGCRGVYLISSMNVSPKKTSAVPFVCAFKLHYIPGISEGDFSLQFRAKMKYY